MTNLTKQNNQQAKPNPGDLLPDGSFYVGMSVDVEGYDLRFFPEQIGNTMTWNQGTEYLYNLKDFHGYQGSAQQEAQEIESASYDGGITRPTLAEASQIYGLLKNFPKLKKQIFQEFGKDDRVHTATSSGFSSAMFLGLSDCLRDSFNRDLYSARIMGVRRERRQP